MKRELAALLLLSSWCRVDVIVLASLYGDVLVWHFLVILSNHVICISYFRDMILINVTRTYGPTEMCTKQATILASYIFKLVYFHRNVLNFSFQRFKL